MARIEMLNAEKHADVRIITRHAADYGDAIDSCLTFPTEFADVQREYPIFFRKDPQTGQFCSVALFGFEPAENLFLSKDQWNASYVPAAVARGPFLISYQDQSSIGLSKQEPVVNIDMSHPRVNREQGEALFVPDGKPSDFLQQVNQYLRALHQGLTASDAMFKLLLELELIEPVTLNIELSSGQQIQLQGNYTIHEEKLAALSGEPLERLHRSGYIQAAFLVVASLTNIKKLVQMKQAR